MSTEHSASLPDGPDSATAGAAPAPSAEAARLRTRSLWAGLMLMPATVLAGILALASENAARCVGYREGCSTTPPWFYLATLAVAVAAWIHTLCTPDATPPAASRKAAFWTLIGAECVFLLLVLTSTG